MIINVDVSLSLTSPFFKMTREKRELTGFFGSSKNQRLKKSNERAIIRGARERGRVAKSKRPCMVEHAGAGSSGFGGNQTYLLQIEFTPNKAPCQVAASILK
jgi:hypothetical protein